MLKHTKFFKISIFDLIHGFFLKHKNNQSNRFISYIFEENNR
jgi:hypothetical protein